MKIKFVLLAFVSGLALRASADQQGFEISPAAAKNFELKSIELSGKGPWRVPSTAILRAGEEINLYRLRDRRYSRVDFQAKDKFGDSILVSSADLREGDLVVVTGVGFLRIAELAAGGISDGHSH